MTKHNMTFNFESLNDSFSFLSAIIHHEGEHIVNRQKKCKEIIPSSICITDPTDLHITQPKRKFNFLYSISEFLWYLSCDLQTKNISKLAKIWSDISDPSGKVVSNYGAIIRSQWDTVINELVSDSESRRATMTLNSSSNNTTNPLDCPCTMCIQFLIRDSKLNLIVTMRSNDIVFGFCNDVFCWCLFQQMMLNELNEKGLDIELGRYIHNVGSLHAYERHYQIIESCSRYNESSRGQIKLKEYVTWKYMEDYAKHMPVKNTSKEELEAQAKKFMAKDVYV